ncbi:conserved exported hypothetical protein [Verrucomicrobia bacterium]|nr:conserved exported hypothetical protein [Verrucomicrobiota bacterium]
MDMQNSTRLGASSHAAFTLIDLLVVVVLLALLVATILPALAKTSLSSKASQCLSNNRLLCAAWRTYADDSRDLILYASDNPGAPNDAALSRYAWVTDHLDYFGGNRGDWDINVGLATGQLWPYTGMSAAIYRCPSDPSFVVVDGLAKPRVRSFSMNLYLGGYDGTDGGWTFVSISKLFLKSTELTDPGPSKTFVFTDERPDFINWGNFFVDMVGYSPPNPAIYEFTADLPGMFHNVGGSFSFADGHAEIHHWTDPRTTPPYSPPASFGYMAVPGDPDVAWLQDKATRPK